jgi:hypothetical protein
MRGNWLLILFWVLRIALVAYLLYGAYGQWQAGSTGRASILVLLALFLILMPIVRKRMGIR